MVINANTTLTVVNTFTANGNEVNTSSPASGFAIIAKTVKADNYIHLDGTLSATGDLATEWGSTITGNVSAKSITSGGSGTYGGNLTATGGDISGGASDTIGGTVTATGKLTTKSVTTITGNVSAKSIVSGGGSTYSGSLTATGGNIDGGSSDTIGGTVTASGVLTTGWLTTITGNVSAKSIVSGGGSTYSGNLTATGGNIDGGSSDTFGGTVTASGVLTTGSSTTITGNVSAKSIVSGGGSTYSGSLTATGGDITSGSADKIAGSVTASAGKVTLNSSKTTVGGSVVASGDVILSSQSVVTGDVTSGQGRVTLKSSATKVGGSVFSWNQATLESGTQVVGSVISYNDNVVLDSSDASVGQCVTAPSSKAITLGWNATVGGVCCDTGSTCGNACVTNSSGKPTPALCSKPATCIIDNFSSGTLDPGLWNALAISGSFVPAVVDVGGQKRLRMTTAVTYQSTMVQLKKWFPGAGNKITVEFNYYVYGGNGADGVTVVFSDASVAAAAGGYGGSLGYAQRSGVNGFAGGWLAIGLDEFGNFPNPTEGRTGYPTGWISEPGGIKVVPAQRYMNNVSVRGSGSAQSGYNLLANTGTLSPVLWQNSNNAGTLQRFRITIDHSNGVNAYVKVERDTTGTGASYVTVVPAFDAKAAPGQAPVPANWLVSFTGSTGASTNIHEIALLSICAPHVTPPGGSTNASSFSCLEQGANTPWVSTARKPLYTKLASTGFKLDIAALKTDGTLETDYITSGGDSKYLRVELFDDTTPAASCAAYTSPVAAQTVTVASGLFSGGRIPTTSNFNLTTAYKKLICRVRECTSSSCATFTSVPAGCSIPEQFSVRPSAATLAATLATAPGPSASDLPTVKAGGNFTLRATTSPSAGYSGTLDLYANKLTVQSGGVVGALTPSSLVANASAVNTTYNDVGYLYLAPGAYRDEAFTLVDRASGDCLSDTDNNLADTLIGPKYGCDIGNKTALTLGRFIPDSFVVSPVGIVPRSDIAACSMSTFTYLGEPFRLTGLTLTAKSVGGVNTTKNYAGDFARLDLSSDVTKVGSLNAGVQHGTSPLFTNFYNSNVALNRLVVAHGGTSFTDEYQASDADPKCLGEKKIKWCNGQAVMGLDLTINRSSLPNSSPDGPFAGAVLGISPVDSDGVKMNTPNFQQDYSGTGSIVGDGKAIANFSGNELRFGRLRLSNAFGSDRRNLDVPVEAQFWSGKSWVRNTDDTCTRILVSAIKLDPLLGGTKVSSDVTLGKPTGDFITLTCPYAACPQTSKPATTLVGTVGLCVDLGPDPTTGVVCSASSASLPYLQGWWPPGGSYDNDPSARATFGIYSPETKRTVHVRESF